LIVFLKCFMIRSSRELIMSRQLNCCASSRDFGFSSCLNCSLLFDLYLWVFTKGNLSQTSCKVRETISSLDLVTVLNSVSFSVSLTPVAYINYTLYTLFLSFIFITYHRSFRRNEMGSDITISSVRMSSKKSDNSFSDL
jgi:hypothetical protein